MRSALLACLVVFAGLAGCVSERGFEPIESAGWQPGYSFMFTAEGTETLDVDMVRDGERVDNVDEASFGPVDYLALRVLDVGTGIGGKPYYLVAASHDEPHLPYSRPDRLEARGNVLDVLLAAHPADLRLGEVRDWDTDEPRVVDSQEAHPWVRFPLAQGDTWSTAAMELAGAPFLVRADAEVGGLVAVDGPAGPVDAVRIRHTFTVAGALTPDEPAADGYAIHSFEQEFEGTSDVYYAPSLHAVVRHDFKLVIETDADITSPEGSFDGRVDYTLEYSLQLTGYDLTVRPPTPLAQAATVLGKPLELPKGAPADPATLVAKASAVRARVGDPALTLSAEGTNVVDGTFAWEIRDALGKVRRVAQGATITFPTAEPGSYTAVATARDRAGWPVESRVGFAIDLHGQRTITCTLVAPGRPCVPVGLPISAGLVSATILATRMAEAPAAGAATLELRQDGRAVEEAAFAGDSATIVLDGPVTDGDWEAAYVTALDSGQVTLDLDFVYEVPQV